MAYSPLLRLASGEGTGSTEGESPLLELASGEAAGTTGRSLMAGGDMSVGPGAAGTAESILMQAEAVSAVWQHHAQSIARPILQCSWTSEVAV
jgi:hypothetical protein